MAEDTAKVAAPVAPVDAKAKIAELLKAMQTTLAKGDVVGTLKLNVELAKAQTAVEGQKVEAEKGLRDAFMAQLGKALEQMAPKGYKMIVNLGREDGRLTKLVVSIEDTQLTTKFWDAYGKAGLDKREPSTLKGIHAEVVDGKATVTLAGPAPRAPRAPGAPGTGTAGGRGKGWSKGSETKSLQEVFEAYATPAEKTELESVKADGNKSYTLKKKVAVTAGWTQNG